MSYENISINIAAVEESLRKLRKARLEVGTELERLHQLANTPGEGLTAEEHRTNEALTTVATEAAEVMDIMIAITGETLAAYAGTDELLARRISRALYGK